MGESEGHNWVLGDGSLAIVHPNQYQSMKLALCGRTLRPSNLIVAASLEYLVDEALAGVGKRAWAKARERLASIRPDPASMRSEEGDDWIASRSDGVAKQEQT